MAETLLPDDPKTVERLDSVACLFEWMRSMPASTRTRFWSALAECSDAIQEVVVRLLGVIKSPRTTAPERQQALMAVVDIQSFASGDFQAARVEAELIENGGVDVGDVVTVLDRVEADLVGRAVDTPPFSPPPAIQTVKPKMWWSRPSAPCEPGVRPNSVANNTSVSSSSPRRSRSSSSAPIGWSTASAFSGMVGLQTAVRVPRPRAAGTVLNLNEPHTSFDQTAGPPAIAFRTPGSAADRSRTGPGFRRSPARSPPTSGMDCCMRKASSYEATRAASAGSLGIFEATQYIESTDQVAADGLCLG
jgi:hypothetical protein